MNAPERHIIMLPQSIEAEQCVIGALLLTCESAWDSVADILTDADF